MISGEEIGGLIQNPHNIQKDQLDDIEKLIEKYPYCSSLYIIQLLGLAKTSSVHFEQKLKIAASHVSDREQLFFLVNPDVEEQIKEEDSVAEEIEIEEKEETITENSSELIEKEKVDEDKPEEKKSEPAPVNTDQDKMSEQITQSELSEIEASTEENGDDDVVKTKVSQDASEVEVNTNISSAEPDTSDKDKSDPLEKTLTAEAIASAFDLDAEVEDEEDEDDLEFNMPRSVTEEHKTDVAQAALKKPDNMTFIQWLKYKQAYANKSGEKSIAKPTESSEKNKLKSTKNSQKQGMSKKEINELLDKFIEEEPTLSRPKKEFFDPSQSAKKSVEESDTIVSETLAKIHFMQGNYSKAIKAYEQLSLLYPEKKAFFANQIEKIKTKQEQDS